MLKKYYTEHDEIKAFVETFHRQANKLLTAHTRKKLTKIMLQLTESPYVSTQHELLCCSSPGLTADIHVEGMDSEGVIHVSVANRNRKEGERHVIHYDCYRVPFRYVRPHSYRHIAETLASSLFPDGLPADRVGPWEMQIVDVLIQYVGIVQPVSWGGYIEDKYLAFDYHFPLLKVTAAINDSIIVKEFCLDSISHAVGTRATLGSYLAIQEQLEQMDALCQKEDAVCPSTKSGSRHLTRQARRLIDLLRVLRRLTQCEKPELMGHLKTLLEETRVTFGNSQLSVVPETTPTLKLTTVEGEWFIALSIPVIVELTGPEVSFETLPEPVVGVTPENVVMAKGVPDDPTVDFLTGHNQPLTKLVKNTLTHSGLYLDKEGGINAVELYHVLETSLNETGPILGWFRQKGIYVKYRVKQKPHPVLPTLLIKVDIIKERPAKRNLVNIDIEVGRDDMDELSYVWKMLWMSLIMQADCS